MYSTQIYQYIPRQLVVIETGSSPRRYNNVYSKILKLHKGSDSRLQFQFLNQEEKPINITNKEITFRLIKYDDSKILLQKSCVNVISLNGICELRISNTDLEHVNTQKCLYSLEIQDELGYNVPGLVDKNGTGRGEIEIVNSIYPIRQISKTMTLLTNTDNSDPGIYYSSILNTQYSSKVTFQITYIGYIGNVSILGSTNGTSNWYVIEDFAYPTIQDGSIGSTIEGYHPYIQLNFESTVGNVSNIVAR